MNRSIPAVLLLAAGVVYACGPRAHSADPEQRKAASGPPIVASLDVQVGDGIEFGFTVTNNAARKLELRFPSGQTHEIVVMDSAGREVWRWSDGRMFTQALQNRLLDSRASLSWREGWRTRSLSPGRYVAVASLLSENKPLEERVEFTIP